MTISCFVFNDNGSLYNCFSWLTFLIGDRCVFLSGKSTIDHIFTGRQSVEKHYEFNKDNLHTLFVDHNS